MPSPSMNGHATLVHDKPNMSSLDAESGDRQRPTFLSYEDGFPFESTSESPAVLPAHDDDQQLSVGVATAPARKSVQFDRPTELLSPPTGIPISQTSDAATGESAAAGRSRERLKARMRSFGLPKKPTHRRTQSAMSPRERLSNGDIRNTAASDGQEETDDEHATGDTSSPATPASGKRRRTHFPDWIYSQTEPNTPLTARFNGAPSPLAETSTARPRPPMPLRRATMNDISESQAQALSEDEGRSRIARSPRWKRRGSSWLQSAQNPSFIAARRRLGHEYTPDKDRSSSAKRPSRPSRSKTSSAVDASPAGWRSRNDPAQRWRQLKAGLKLIGQKRKVEKGADYVKSAELMAELLAGSPAALILASNFQRDEHAKKKVPVLLEQLKIRITDSEFVDDSTDRHVKFRIELEYGNGLMRMQWIVWRYLTDFVNLHLKYASSALTNIRRKGGNPIRGKLPRFPKSAFPVLRGARGAPLTDDDDDEAGLDYRQGEITPLASGNTPISRPGPGHTRRTSYHMRSSSAGGSQVLGGTDNSGAEASGLAKRDVFAERQRRKLEIYLREMIRFFIFRAGSNRLCKFLEISALGVNLAAEGGYHGKEGILIEKKGKNIGKTTTSRWFLVRQSYIVCVESPEETVLADVFLVDPDFECQAKRPRIRDQKGAKAIAKTAKTSAAHPKHHRLKLLNSERKVTLVARNERQQEQFAESIQFMRDNTEWAKPHRFDSFAPVRKNVFAEWLVDARDYMWKVSRAISMAENVIYIHDWWLSPELYLRRPPAISHKWRLDRLLQRKAQEGVKIYVIMYRNINSAIPIDSEYTKMSLLDLHPNIYVQRSPNQYRQNVFFWAHHEKLCIVDHIVAFCGGVDLCFGRWDTPQHRVMDDKRTGLEPGDFPRDADNCQLWPGKDYSNPRVQDFFKLDDPYGEMYDRTKTPRMPWHDIGMQVVGQPARDLTRHFVQRWNFLLRQRTPHRPIPVLLPPPDFNPEDLRNLGFDGTCDIQMLRSCAEWSIGTPGKTEHSIMNAYVKLIEESDHFVYIENQFFITSCSVENTTISNKIGDALVDRIIKAYESEEEWKAVVVIPLVPGFQNLVHETDGTSVRLIMECQFRSICRGSTSIWGRLLDRGIEPIDYIEFYSLRSWGKIGPNKALTTEQLYIHAKCMIVDDRHVIIGSANINERSMLGNRDSEVAAIVRDKDMLDSVMAGQPYKVGRFPHTLRMRLMREHLGIDVDALREHEVEDFYQHELDDDLDDSSYPGSGSRNPTPYKDSAFDKGIDKKLPIRHTHSLDNLPSRPRDGAATALGRDSTLFTGKNEGRDIDTSPKKSLSKGRSDHTRQAVDSTSEVNGGILPPAMPPRMSTPELGLTQLSLLPALPESDDTDIGGPPMTSASSDPLLSEIRQPVVEIDCMKDPLSKQFAHHVWHTIAVNNTKLFRQVFRCMPDNQVKDWATYWDFTEYGERFNVAQGVAQPKGRTQNGTPNKTGPPGTGAERAPAMLSAGKGVSEKLFDETIFMEDKAKEAEISEAMGTQTASMLTPGHEIKRLHTGVSAASTATYNDHDDPSNENLSMPTNDSSKSRIGFDALPSRDGAVPASPPDEKKPLNGSIYTNKAATVPGTKKRRRATTKSSAGLRPTDPVLSKTQAEELLNLVQGHLVVFPYRWLEKEEEGSKWLYGVDQMAPLEIYN